MSFFEVLVDAACKATCVLGLGLGLQILVRRNPLARRSIGAAAMGLVLALSGLAFLAPVGTPIEVGGTAVVASRDTTSFLSWPGLLIMAWAAGAVAVGFLHGFGLAALRRVHVHSALLPSREGVSAVVRQTSDPRVGVPVAYGVLKPTILLPACSLEWTFEQVEAILAHEGSHLRMRDPLALVLAQIVCTLHWFNPLAWLCLWRFRQDCEAVCDQAALATGIRPSTYAELLVRESLRAGRVMPGHVVLPIVRESGLAVRIRAVLSTDGSVAPNSFRRGVLTPPIVGLLFLFGSHRLSFAGPPVVDKGFRDGFVSKMPLSDAERRAIEERLIAAQRNR